MAKLKRALPVVLPAILLCVLLTGCFLFPLPDVGGELNLYGIDPYTLDPALSSDATSHQYILQLFSGLVGLDDDLEPVPDIAETWEINEEGTIYTFYLREDAVFHDGREIKAADFKYSWERACDPELESQTAKNFLGDIVGASDVISGESDEISGVRIVDDYTLEVTIDAPKSYFTYKLSYPVAFVVDRDNVAEGMGWWRHPNGSGPFKLGQWAESTLLVLNRNDFYYGEKAKLESVVYQLLAGVPMNMYENGEIDVSGVSLINYDKVTDPAGPFYNELSIVPELSLYYIGFNSQQPPFDDINIRRAFTMAIDKDKLVSLMVRDMVQPAPGILPPGMPGYNDTLEGLEFNPEEAKRLIAESEYGDVANLPPITITTSGYGGIIPSSLEAIIHQWRQNLGVEVKVRQLEPERFFYHLKQEKDEMFEIGWFADYPHPQGFLEVLFASDSRNNYGDYNNPAIDDLLEMAGAETDIMISLQLYREAEQMLVEDAACLPLWFGRNYILVKPYVKGYYLNPQGLVMLNKVWLEDED